jgi:hypothetical protein
MVYENSLFAMLMLGFKLLEEYFCFLSIGRVLIRRPYGSVRLPIFTLALSECIISWFRVCVSLLVATEGGRRVYESQYSGMFSIY